MKRALIEMPKLSFYVLNFTIFISTLQVGQKIQHERFGIGEVIKVEGTGDNAKATISFLHAGQKQLLLRFARFKII